MGKDHQKIAIKVKAAQRERREKRRRVLRFPTEQPTARRLLELVEGLEWYALRVAPQKEFAVQEILLRKGVTTYCPSDRRWRKVSRYVREKELQSFPLVPGYVFAGFPPGAGRWFELFAIPIVLGCVGIDGVPARIRATAMERMIKVYRNGLSRPDGEKFMRTHAEFKTGDRVRIAEGPFTDHVVPVIEIHGKMARILMDLFGVMREMDIPSEILEPAA
ncbi:transcription termination/antitermination NusG family protein [Xanthobacter sp. DSM 24535]|uniref:transcription termination/antitermination protein NusG n=1 Tax=Roseixanthobacter psychrophilus TaxID=3119917 RepID=UPI00372763E3